jgi:hypothetical protein
MPRLIGDGMRVSNRVLPVLDLVAVHFEQLRLPSDLLRLVFRTALVFHTARMLLIHAHAWPHICTLTD